MIQFKPEDFARDYVYAPTTEDERRRNADLVKALVAEVKRLGGLTTLEGGKLLAVAINHPAYCPIYDGQRCTCGYGRSAGAYWPASDY
jgi:hypothetical protein